MRTRTILLLLGLALLVFLLVAPVVVERRKAGGRVGPATKLVGGVATLDGKPASPIDLASAAGVPLREYALARMIASEVHPKRWTRAEAEAKAWTAVNDANASSVFKGDLLRLLTYDTNPAQRGFFGDQTGRRVATSQDPLERDLEVARGVLHGTIADSTGGADKFLDAGALGAQLGISKEAAAVRLAATDKTWKDEGRERFTIAGVSTWFYRRTSSAAGVA